MAKLRIKPTIIAGVGINDAQYVQQKFENTGERLPSGKFKYKLVWTCPYFKVWKSMIDRCYAPSSQKAVPTYHNVTVSSEWLVFSVFKRWMESQDWKGKHLDKDFLENGDKVYSKSTCVFIDSSLNKFITDHKRARGAYLLGVTARPYGKFRARCSNPFTGKYEVLGDFNDELSAHYCWLDKKNQHAQKLAEVQKDIRVKNKLRTMYLKENWIPC
uniref:DNA binding protein n=1 Tax=Vibrio phage P018-4 TaxID=3229728 RepID=A0AB39AJF1_9CAUD